MFLQIIQNILTGFAIGVLLYIIVGFIVHMYKWRKLKNHVIAAIDEQHLWHDFLNTRCLTPEIYRSITKYLDAHKYSHCFYSYYGPRRLALMLSEIQLDLMSHIENNTDYE